VKIVARSKRSSGKRNGSRKSTGAPPDIDSAEASRNDEDRQRTLKRTIVVAVIAAAGVAAAGIGFYFLNGSRSAWNARDASVATFVGSEICAGCHRAQAELWHRHAAGRADERAKRLRQSVKEHDAKDRAERRTKAAGNDHRQRFDPDRRIEAVDIEITDEVAK
jgi:predicted Fe-S protein YdhL (DUF1289 family)